MLALRIIRMALLAVALLAPAAVRAATPDPVLIVVKVSLGTMPKGEQTPTSWVSVVHVKAYGENGAAKLLTFYTTKTGYAHFPAADLGSKQNCFWAVWDGKMSKDQRCYARSQQPDPVFINLR